MASLEEHLSKLRDQRIAREKARIEKLRELNLKKYNKNDLQFKFSHSNITKESATNKVKNHLHLTTAKRPSTAPVPNKNVPSKNIANGKSKDAANGKSKDAANGKTKDATNCQSNAVGAAKDIHKDKVHVQSDNKSLPTTSKGIYIKPYIIPSHHVNQIAKPNATEKKLTTFIEKNKRNVYLNASTSKVTAKQDPKIMSNNIAPKMVLPKPSTSRMSLQPPKPTQSNIKSSLKRESVFERLYKGKAVEEKLHTNLKPTKVIKDYRPVLERRSISAIHFKKFNKNDIPNCIHKWASIDNKLNKVHLKEINEDEDVNEEKVISAIKSERKKVKFQTPVPFNFNTPKPEELQSKLKSWLQKRGKSLESYHHLQCFGLHHLASKNIKPIEIPNLQLDDDENKENVALESDSDNDSYAEIMNEEVENKKEPVENIKGDFSDNNKYFNNLDTWREASYITDSGDCNESHSTTLTPSEIGSVHHVDELLTGALNDLTELLREGFDWEQCARWLRAVRERFPSAPDTAPYWECRAALEERRGDLPASVQCWEEAIAKGTAHSVVEANLDQLLDKFMLLKISPNNTKRKMVDPKMVDVKNVFKSTIIRFAVQQAKLRKSSQHDPPKYTVTPVRRSGRLSSQWSAKRTPLRDCVTLRQAKTIAQPLTFVPNDLLTNTP